MTDPEFVDPSLDPQVQFIAVLLERDRPRPQEGFRGRLARRLADRDPGWGPRPEHLWRQASALVLIGAALVVIGALVGTAGI